MSEFNKSEEWRDIENYEGHYQISNHHRVKSLARISAGRHKRKVPEKILAQTENTRGNLQIMLYKNNRGITWRIERLVKSAFPELN